MTSGDLSMTIRTDDADATFLVEKVSQAFAESGGVWMRGDLGTAPDDDDDVDEHPAGSVVRWFPAAGTQVTAYFDDAANAADLSDVPGLLA